MPKHIISTTRIPAVKIPVTRKNISVRTNSTIKVEINGKPVLNLQSLQAQPCNRMRLAKSAVRPPKVIQAVPKPTKASKPIPSGAVAKERYVKRQRVAQKGQVKYVTHDVSPESIARIRAIRGIGIGKILVIIGNGPSILEAPLQQLKGHPKIDTMSINKPDPRVWPTAYWTFLDPSQLTRHEELWNSYNGIIFNSASIKRIKLNTINVKQIGGKGFSRDLSIGMHIGNSSVFSAMQIGYWMNYEHIYLMGVDMNPAGVDGKLHFYGTNPDVKPETRRGRFEKEAKSYLNAATTVLTEAERAKYTFCSSYNQHSFVDYFNRLDHKSAVGSIIERANSIK